MQLLRAVGAVALLSSAASAVPNVENSNGFEKRDPEPNLWPFGRERHRHHHHQQFKPSEGSNVTNTMGGTVALNAQSLVAATTTNGEHEACPTVITSFVTVTTGPTATRWIYANSTSVARNSSVPGVSWVANATSTSSSNGNAIVTGTSIWNGTLSAASSASTISLNGTASVTSTPATFISVTSGIAFNASAPTGSSSSLAQTELSSRSTASPVVISSPLLASVSSSSPGTLLAFVSSSALASSGSVNIVSPIVLPTSAGGSPLPSSANIVSPIVMPTATPLSSASQPTSTTLTTFQTSISTIVALPPPSTISTTSATWTSVFVNASPVSVGTNTPPGTTVSATTTVTSTQSSGTPNPAAVHCGVHGFAVGDFFYAEYVEDSINVPVSLLGCHEFCLLDAGTCVSYEYYLEEGLGAPRCNLYLGSVADSLESINKYVPNVWYDLACGIPS